MNQTKASGVTQPQSGARGDCSSRRVAPDADAGPIDAESLRLRVQRLERGRGIEDGRRIRMLRGKAVLEREDLHAAVECASRAETVVEDLVDRARIEPAAMQPHLRRKETGCRGQPIPPQPERALGAGDLEVVECDAVGDRQCEIGREQVGELPRGRSLDNRVWARKARDLGTELLDASDPRDDARVEGEVGEHRHRTATSA